MYPRQNTTKIAAIGLLLYLLTIIADIIPISIRFLFGSILSELVVWGVAPASALTFPSFFVGLILAFAPVLWGIVALTGLPSGGTFTRYELTGRAPNAQEQDIVERTLAFLSSIHPRIRRPRTWFVSNTIEPETLAIGTTLFINSDLLQGNQQYLTASLAHALGHLNTLDSRLIEALKRLQIRFAVISSLPSLKGGRLVASDLVLTFIAGGQGLRITSSLWRRYFHTCEYAADEYAASLGQAQTLARAVDNLNTPLDVPFDWMWDLAGTSEYAEKRLTLLRQQPPTQKTKGQWLDESKAFIERKLYWEAVAACEQALCHDPNDAKAYTLKSLALRNLQRYEEALAACNEALRLDPTALNVYDAKARILAHFKRYEEALATYDQLLSLDPNVTVAYVNKGDIFLSLQRYEEAIAICEQALRLDPLRLDPNSTVAYMNIGLALANLQRYEEALVAYDEALRLDPTYVNGYFYKGFVLSELQRYEEALSAYEEALRLDPNNARYYNSKGLVLYNLKRYQEALIAYEQAIHLSPKFARAYYSKGLTLEAMGKKQKAQQAYERARQWGYSGL